jgi:hypothetical protein
MDEVKRNISSFQEQADQLKARKTSVEAHEAVKAHQYNDLTTEIGNVKRAIERNIATALNRKVQIA